MQFRGKAGRGGEWCCRRRHRPGRMLILRRHRRPQRRRRLSSRRPLVLERSREHARQRPIGQRHDQRARARRSRRTSSRAPSPPSSRSTPTSPSTTTRSAPARAAPTCTRTRCLFAGSDSPDPGQGGVQGSRGQDGAVLPGPDRPDRDRLQPVRRQRPEADATVLAGIFQGTITTWNDPAIKALNPGAQPARAPRSPSRSARTPPAPRRTSPSTSWTRRAAPGSSAPPRPSPSRSRPTPTTAAARVAAGRQGHLGLHRLRGLLHRHRHRADRRVDQELGRRLRRAVVARRPTAAATHVTPKADLTFSTADEPGATSYPITYQSWDLVYATQPNANDVALLKAYLGYLLGSAGQALLTPLNLAPLPASIDSAAVAQLSKITS